VPIAAVQTMAAAAEAAVTNVLPAATSDTSDTSDTSATEPGGSPASGPPASTTAEPTRAELYKTAQRLDIPGRSKMTRDELAAAVRAAGG
jgi:hypothetical protein